MAEPEQIVQSLGEDFLAYDLRRLDTQISRLRRKAEQATGMTLPINSAGYTGYRFYADAQVGP
jgi:DNA-binding response OmpR family regulator